MSTRICILLVVGCYLLSAGVESKAGSSEMEQPISGRCASTLTEDECKKGPYPKARYYWSSVVDDSSIPTGCHVVLSNSYGYPSYYPAVYFNKAVDGTDCTRERNCLCKRVKGTCPEYDTDFYSNEFGYHRPVDSWEACSILCKNNPNCLAWTWNSGRKICHYKYNNWWQGRRQQKGTISGSRGCVGVVCATAKTTGGKCCVFPFWFGKEDRGAMFASMFDTKHTKCVKDKKDKKGRTWCRTDPNRSNFNRGKPITRDQWDWCV